MVFTVVIETKPTDSRNVITRRKVQFRAVCLCSGLTIGVGTRLWLLRRESESLNASGGLEG